MTSLACAVVLAWAAQQAPAAPAQATSPERARLEKEIAELDQRIGSRQDREDSPDYTLRGKAWFRLARLVQAAGEDPARYYANAIKDLTVTRCGPDDEAAMYLGYSFLCYGDSERGRDRDAHDLLKNAQGNFDIAWTINKQRVETFVGRGQTYLALGGGECLEAALGNFDVAITLDPKRAAIHRLRAKALRGLGKEADAKAAEKRAEELSPAPSKEITVSPALEKEIAALIVQLGADSWEDREKASARLVQIGEPALAALEKAAKHDDPEVLTRAEAALRTIRSKQDQDGLLVPLH